MNASDGAITDVAGLEVGHYTDLENATGCTVVLCRDGAAGGVDVRGGSPGTGKPTFWSRRDGSTVSSPWSLAAEALSVWTPPRG